MELSMLRQRITSIDSELLRLLEERMELAKQVAEYKKINNLPIFDASREEEILSKIPPLYHRIWQEIMNTSKQIQKNPLQ